MKLKQHFGFILAGGCAGGINGLFGAGGGMVLVPLLTTVSKLEDEEVFPASVCIILPICLVSLSLSAPQEELKWAQIFPYLLGSAIGGIGAGIWGRKIPTKWLHRILGILILWGGVQYLC